MAEPTDEEWKAHLRRLGWLRNDGDGERLHTWRPPLPPSQKEEAALARWSGGAEAKPEPVANPEPPPGDVRDMLLDFFDLPFPDRHKLVVKWFGGRPAGTEEEVVSVALLLRGTEEVVSMALLQAVMRGMFDAMAADVANAKGGTDG